MKRHPPDQGQRVQLHRALSKLGWGSRGQAWGWIEAGEVEVDGQVITDPLTWIDLGRQHITRRGQTLKKMSITLALNKPRGVVTTRRDERGRKVVYDLLPPGLPWLFPVGRLDAESEGLLILTNDSALSTRLTDPQFHVQKTYNVTLKDRHYPELIRQLCEGVDLSDGRTRPARVRSLNDGRGRQLEFVLTEGRNRQIRRMAAALGNEVERLIRVGIGGLSLGSLEAGTTRELSEEERDLLVQGSSA